MKRLCLTSSLDGVQTLNCYMVNTPYYSFIIKVNAISLTELAIAILQIFKCVPNPCYNRPHLPFRHSGNCHRYSLSFPLRCATDPSQYDGGTHTHTHTHTHTLTLPPNESFPLFRRPQCRSRHLGCCLCRVRGRLSDRLRRAEELPLEVFITVISNCCKSNQSYRGRVNSPWGRWGLMGPPMRWQSLPLGGP